jgi:hypothetical protein
MFEIGDGDIVFSVVLLGLRKRNEVNMPQVTECRVLEKCDLQSSSISLYPENMSQKHFVLPISDLPNQKLTVEWEEEGRYFMFHEPSQHA